MQRVSIRPGIAAVALAALKTLIQQRNGANLVVGIWLSWRAFDS
jgi:hypothetical protein